MSGRSCGRGSVRLHSVAGMREAGGGGTKGGAAAGRVAGAAEAAVGVERLPGRDLRETSWDLDMDMGVRRGRVLRKRTM